MDNIQSAYEGGLIEAMSGLLTHTQNPHVKQLCRAIIMIVSVLGGEKEEQVDFANFRYQNIIHRKKNFVEYA
ncbi:MAG: hypothetical protein EZS28_042825 [Streblomastix strix]|uniref:Uncharacterized protein n=1 Tax=Streblomastix strix TaxID=222440 RepID=A0A5J4TTY0_9EUKA|nr:MAG: hypothetical protein EZS28_042825 [Streblomastix strix]